MTDLDKPVRRRTVSGYRITVTSAEPCQSGRRLIVELANNGKADLIRIREAGRRSWVELDVAGLYRRGLLAQISQRQRGKRRKRK